MATKGKSLVKLKVDGIGAIEAALTKRAQMVRDNTLDKMVVGFTAPYAIYVHENLTARHRIGQAKFLEVAARKYQREIAEVVKRALASHTPLNSAIALGAIHLLRRAQQLCPVDTGFLRDSGYARVDHKQVPIQ